MNFLFRVSNSLDGTVGVEEGKEEKGKVEVETASLRGEREDTLINSTNAVNCKIIPLFIITRHELRYKIVYPFRSSQLQNAIG